MRNNDIQTIMDVTGETKRNILDHVKYIQEKNPNYAELYYGGVRMSSYELGDFVVYRHNVKRLHSAEKARDILIANQTNTDYLHEIISKINDDIRSINKEKF